MARDLSPILKRSRREGVAMHPKAIKGLQTRGYAPGEHGQGGRRQKPSQYSLQLREKQKVKRMYGLLEKQFAKLLSEAERRTGVTGELLLSMLERRLDNAVYRLGFAPSRQGARQLVTHGHFLLNGRRVDIPSIQLSPGDEVQVRPTSLARAYFQNLAVEFTGSKTQLSWASLDPKKLSFKVTGLPARDDAEPDINEQLIIEFYSR